MGLHSLASLVREFLFSIESIGNGGISVKTLGRKYNNTIMERLVEEKLKKYLISKERDESSGKCLYQIAIFLPPRYHLLFKIESTIIMDENENGKEKEKEKEKEKDDGGGVEDDDEDVDDDDDDDEKDDEKDDDDNEIGSIIHIRTDYWRILTQIDDLFDNW